MFSAIGFSSKTSIWFTYGNIISDESQINVSQVKMLCRM